MNKFDLEERLIDFAVLTGKIVDKLPNTAKGKYYGGQLLRSGASPALNYGEALSAESRKDFIHKVKIVLKELRETHACLKIIKRSSPIKEIELLNDGIKECNELISIFVKSCKTAENNLRIKSN